VVYDVFSATIQVAQIQVAHSEHDFSVYVIVKSGALVVSLATLSHGIYGPIVQYNYLQNQFRSIDYFV
jgi:hypothetical protein